MRDKCQWSGLSSQGPGRFAYGGPRLDSARCRWPNLGFAGKWLNAGSTVIRFFMQSQKKVRGNPVSFLLCRQTVLRCGIHYRKRIRRVAVTCRQCHRRDGWYSFSSFHNLPDKRYKPAHGREDVEVLSLSEELQIQGFTSHCKMVHFDVHA
jgi:hypothetical protein